FFLPFLLLALLEVARGGERGSHRRRRRLFAHLCLAGAGRALGCGLRGWRGHRWSGLGHLLACLDDRDAAWRLLYARRGFSALLRGTPREAEASAIRLDAQDAHRHLVALLEHLLGILGAVGQLGEVDQPLDAVLDAGEGAKGRDLGNRPLHELPDLVALLDRGPRIDLGPLDRQGDLLLLLVDREHLHLDLLADLEDLAGVVDAAPGQLANVYQPVGTAEIDEGAEIGQVAHRAGAQL